MFTSGFPIGFSDENSRFAAVVFTPTGEGIATNKLAIAKEISLFNRTFRTGRLCGVKAIRPEGGG